MSEPAAPAAAIEERLREDAEAHGATEHADELASAQNEGLEAEQQQKTVDPGQTQTLEPNAGLEAPPVTGRPSVDTSSEAYTGMERDLERAQMEPHVARPEPNPCTDLRGSWTARKLADAVVLELQYQFQIGKVDWPTVLYRTGRSPIRPDSTRESPMDDYLQKCVHACEMSLPKALVIYDTTVATVDFAKQAPSGRSTPLGPHPSMSVRAPGMASGAAVVTLPADLPVEAWLTVQAKYNRYKTVNVKELDAAVFARLAGAPEDFVFQTFRPKMCEADANAFAAWFVKYIHDTRCEFAKTKIKAQTTKKRSSLGGAVAAVAGAAMTAAAAVMGHRAAQTLPSRKK